MKIEKQLPNRHLRNKKSALQLLTGVTFVLLLPQAYSAEFTTKATITAGVEYDSNPAMTNGQKNPVLIYSLNPDLLLDVKEESNQWYLDASLMDQRYSNEKVLVNRDDPKLVAGFNHTYESGLIGIKASYWEASSVLDQLTTTGILSQVNNTERNQLLAVNWQQTINSRWSALTNAAYHSTRYSIASPFSLSGYEFDEIGSKLTYANNDQLDTYAQLGYAFLNPDLNFESTNKVNLMVGTDYKINENLKLNASAGIYNLSGRQTDTSWEGDVSAIYTGEHIHYSAGLNRGIAPTGLGGFQKSNALKLGLAYNRTEYDRFEADYAVTRYIKDASIIGLDKVDYQQVSAFYERDLSIHWKARISATYRILESTARSNGSLIGATLSYDTLSF